jgi:hypothetical protein
MITDLTALAATLLANFRTVRIPAPDDHQGSLMTGGRRQRRGEPKNVRRSPAATGSAVNWPTCGHPFLDHLEADPDAGGDSTFSSPMTLPWRFWT